MQVWCVLRMSTMRHSFNLSDDLSILATRFIQNEDDNLEWPDTINESIV
jgi:hypothetical protein